MASKDFNSVPFTYDEDKTKTDFRIRAGDSIVYPFQVQIDGSDTDLSTCTVQYAVDERYADTTAIGTAAITPDVAASGQCTLNITSTQTSSLSGEYEYEVEVIWPSGHADVAQGAVKTWIAGEISVTAGIAG